MERIQNQNIKSFEEIENEFSRYGFSSERNQNHKQDEKIESDIISFVRKDSKEEVAK